MTPLALRVSLSSDNHLPLGDTLANMHPKKAKGRVILECLTLDNPVKRQTFFFAKSCASAGSSQFYVYLLHCIILNAYYVELWYLVVQLKG